MKVHYFISHSFSAGLLGYQANGWFLFSPDHKALLMLGVGGTVG